MELSKSEKEWQIERRAQPRKLWQTWCAKAEQLGRAKGEVNLLKGYVGDKEPALSPQAREAEFLP